MRSAPDEGPITIAVSRTVAPGKDEDFAIWAAGISEAAASFPGHLGAGHIRPARPDGEHTIIYRFDTREHFNSWQSSDERNTWVEQSRNFVIGAPTVQTATGLEYWFRDPSCSGEGRSPVWKQALLTWVGLYPTVLAVAYTIGLLLAGWSVPLRSLVTTAFSVLLMTWVVMPAVTRLFRPFLHPGAPALVSGDDLARRA